MGGSAGEYQGSEFAGSFEVEVAELDLDSAIVVYLECSPRLAGEALVGVNYAGGVYVARGDGS